jgi:ABC-type glycerol-3-phosphate transport system substrate-binding protein
MKSATLILIFVLLLAACSSPKKTTSTAEGPSSGITNSSSIKDGSSFEKAIIIKKRREGPGVDAEYKWLAQNYPGYKRISQSLTHKGNKHYDIIALRPMKGSKKIFILISLIFLENGDLAGF